MKLRKASLAIATGLALSLTLTACGGGAGSDDSKIVIGIKFDQPGIGLKTPEGNFTGLDVDVATYVAKELGYEAKDIEWKQAPSADRETLIRNGDVKFVAASYTINDKRKAEVDFAGPYFLAHQDLLVRADDNSITKVEDLNKKKLCSVRGSTSAQNVKDKRVPGADLQQYGGYSECLTGLENKAVDALTTDDAILAGYASQKEHQGKFKLLGLKLSEEPYGIGLKKGDKELRDKINKALEKMQKDDSWNKFVQKNLGPSQYQSEPAPKITETS
ncbi:glutamate ABC transporter substrate-binding protein [Streptomyces clavuligerus]|nr:glutamate ABC transporter substrate-binding protein [Streptomyces clavuligerus]MBY6302163.1 glutamate ABC transporter substrate-binding protein [Streptomyces clavuligerus]QPL62377.1 glutamate ABC transporter substrate-binding protein [Streptomyces clavuligerus]QPL68409.1 glutamate ABC transporter substrate-binding protein [Streptomyces clavuligerus]QPL74488.1 glutamate ABC transporter substrate-binding protein [Streptomyces clavuligerus]QPL80514.1 glutamate ABC transporter substrate-binding